MNKKLASLIIKIAADGAEAEKMLRSLEKSVGQFGKSMKKVGDNISKYVTAPLTALAGVSVAAANTQLQAEAKLLTALKGREDVQRRLMASAAELQSRSTLGDEVIIDQQAYLAALGLTEAQINALIEAAVQLSYATGMELEGAVKNLAKTYSGLTGELGESIPALKDFTAEELKAGAAIEYIGNNYKGFAEAAASTGAGPMVQLKNQLGDLAEQIGIILLPVLQELTEWLSEVVSWLQTLSPETMEWVVGIGAAVAALGPLLSIVGRLTTAIPALFTFLATPVGGIVAGLGLVAGAFLSVANSAKQAEEHIRAYRQSLYEERKSEAYNTAMQMYNRASVSDEELQSLIKEYTDMLNADVNSWQIANGGGLSKAQREALSVQKETIRALEDIVELRAREREDAAAIAEAARKQAESEERRAEAARQIALQSSVNRWREENKTPIQSIAADLSSLTAPVEAIDPAMFTLKGAEVLNGMVDLREQFSESEGVAEEIRERSVSIANSVSGAFQNIIVGFGKGIGDLMSGNAFNPFKMMIEAIGNMLVQLGTTIITTSELFITLKSTIGSAGFGALSIPIGIAAIAAGQLLINQAGVMKLAKGGLAYGPTLAVVGDNPGAAHDPEVVAPLSKLRQYMGGMQLELVGAVQFELHGDTARAILDRENVRLKRRG